MKRYDWYEKIYDGMKIYDSMKKYDDMKRYDIKRKKDGSGKTKEGADL